MLGRPMQSLTQPTSEAPGSVKFHENETYTATCAISAEKPDAASPATWQHRGIILLSRRIYLARQATASAEGEGEDANEDTTPVENALFVISPGRLGQDTPSAPVVTMMAGEGSFSAPAGQCEYGHSLSSRHRSLKRNSRCSVYVYGCKARLVCDCEGVLRTLPEGIITSQHRATEGRRHHHVCILFPSC